MYEAIRPNEKAVLFEGMWVNHPVSVEWFDKAEGLGTVRMSVVKSYDSAVWHREGPTSASAVVSYETRVGRVEVINKDDSLVVSRGMTAKFDESTKQISVDTHDVIWRVL